MKNKFNLLNTVAKFLYPGLLNYLLFVYYYVMFCILVISSGYTQYFIYFLGLYDEGAIVLGRLGRHEDALTIYTHILQNFSKAEK